MSHPRQHSHLLPDAGHVACARGDLYLFKVRAVQTEGHYSLFEARHLPGGGVPLHYHDIDEEAFYIIDGTYEFQIGDRHVEAGRGECLHIPRPLSHSFRNIGDDTARLLAILSPGGNHERYFDEGWPSADDIRDLPRDNGAPDWARVGAALERASLHMLDTPPSE